MATAAPGGFGAQGCREAQQEDPGVPGARLEKVLGGDAARGRRGQERVLKAWGEAVMEKVEGHVAGYLALADKSMSLV